MTSEPKKAKKEEKVENVIYLTQLNGTGYIFNVDDYLRVRSEFRIVGGAVGAASAIGWPATDNVLPIELSPLETRFLVEQGVAFLVSKQEDLLCTPSADELEQYHKTLNARIDSQADELKASKLRQTERHMSQIISGRRKKLLKQGVPEEEIDIKPADVLKEVSDQVVFTRNNALLEIPYAHPEPHKALIINLPPDRSLKYRVFKDFWSRGKYITCGDVFGADFAVYPGDPGLYHASHIVTLLAEPMIPPLRLISKARLAIMVNKICVFAYFEVSKDLSEDEEERGDAEPRICYQTVKWTGDQHKERRKRTLNVKCPPKMNK